MKLIRLTIHAFKGISAFDLRTNGQNVDIYAANGVGKTTIADSFSWLLFGRDSLGRADFGIIPTDANGLVVEGASPTVTAKLWLPDGEPITLQRQLMQKNLSVRGAAPTAAGTTTDYAIDGVPVKKTEYTRRIAEIADEALFPILTDPRAFCGTLHWQKRRDLLMRLFGGTTDGDIIAGEPALSALPAILGKRTTDEHRRMLRPKLAELKKQVDEIAASIKGAKRIIPPAPAGDPAADLATLREGRSRTQAEYERIASGGESADLRRQLAEVKARIVDAETAAKRADAERLSVLDAARRAAREKLAEREYLLAGVARRIASAEQDMNLLAEESAANSASAQRIADRPPPEVGFDDACPTCGQQLPPEHLRAAVDSALAEHNRERSEALEKLAARAAEIVKQYADAERGRNNLHRQAEQVERSIVEAAQALQLAEDAIDPFFTLGADTRELRAQADALTAKIAELDSGNEGALTSTRAALDQIDAQIASAETALADIRAREQAEASIATFTAERRALAEQLGNFEAELALCDLFTRRKVTKVTGAINSHFDGLRWKLFDQQVNGEIADCCEVMLDGVTWPGLSNSEQINTGLAVIDVIGKHHGITPPIFVDNAESVSAIYPTAAQQIRLIVSPAHKQLEAVTDEHF